MSNNHKKISGFGFDPEESEHHYSVYIKPGNKDVFIFEMQEYHENLVFETLSYKITSASSPAKCILPVIKWNLIKDDFRAEFNKRLKKLNLPSAQWKNGFNMLHRVLGKELLVLAWAVEDADPGTIPLAIQNWLGLKPEERWWLHSMTNAATGHALNGKGKGWRKAIRYALTENPVIADKVSFNIYGDDQLPSLFDSDESYHKFGSK